ncbi:MAG: NAD(P)-binding domain-containing protein [Planctomycetes bacterium]|nr:NAD(P)-binding domain-containing protein [Planctomycetota bacterium]
MLQSPRTLLVVGAGPIGIEAGVAARARGLDVTVVERGVVADNVRRWGFVTLFSPWKLDTSTLGERALLEERAGTRPPDREAFPSGSEFVERYVEPLAKSSALRGRILEHTRVVSIGREGLLKGEQIGTSDRAARPFRVLVEDESGRERVLKADAVFDCSGTYGNSNEVGEGGIAAVGERAASARIRRAIPDVDGADRSAFVGRRTLVVGHGYSAATALAALARLAERNPETRATWAFRSDATDPYALVPDDPLPARAELASLANRIANGGVPSIAVRRGTRLDTIESRADGGLDVTLVRGNEHAKESFDEVIALVGYRPDASIHRELQVHQCYASEGPMRLAAALLSSASSNPSGDCLAQTTHGADTLRNPEPNFFILGAKSYGRGSSFLLKIGIEQVGQAMTLLLGEGASR